MKVSPFGASPIATPTQYLGTFNSCTVLEVFFTKLNLSHFATAPSAFMPPTTIMSSVEMSYLALQDYLGILSTPILLYIIVFKSSLQTSFNAVLQSAAMPPITYFYPFLHVIRALRSTIFLFVSKQLIATRLKVLLSISN